MPALSERTNPRAVSYREQGVQVQSSTRSISTLGVLTRAFIWIPKRCCRLALVAGLLVSLTIVYFALFGQAAPDQIMKMNHGGVKLFDFRHPHDDKSLALSRKRGWKEGYRKRPRQQTDEQNEDNVLDLMMTDEDDVERTQEESGQEDETEVQPGSHEGPRDELNKQRDKLRGSEDKPKGPKDKLKNPEDEPKAPEEEVKSPEDELKNPEDELKGKALWEKFVKDNEYTAIGVVLDSCDKPSEQLGTVVLMPDPEFGGVKFRTFYNFTLDRDLEDGTFNVDIKYNGKGLYDNWWELCEMEEDEDIQNRTFVCPLKRGPMSIVKDKHIPSYLPTGRYQSKAWLKDDKERMLFCGLSDLTL